MLDGIARSVGRAATAARIATHTFLPVDTNPVPGGWRHVTKVDPEEDKRLPLLFPLYLRHTDAVSVGGSRDVTPENTEATFELLSYSATPAFHEPSAPEHVTDVTRERAAFLAIPEVLNGDVESLVGQLGAGIEHVRENVAPGMVGRRLPWMPAAVRSALSDFAASWMMADANFEAYVIQNPDCAAAREASVGPGDVLGPGEAARRAMAAERRLGSEVVYVEYSGTYGGSEAHEVLAAVEEERNWSRVWYGGGIDSRERARETLAAGADAIVVGDAFHEVAEEEAEVCAAAVADLESGADREAVVAFVDDRVDPADTRAARYLETIPSVDRPAERARQYLVGAALFGVELEALVGAAPADPDADDLRESIRDRGLPGAAAFAALEDADLAREYAGALARTALAARTGAGAASLPGEHLAALSRIAPDAANPD